MSVDYAAMKIRACYITSSGQKRPRNEDSILLNDLIFTGISMTEKACIESEKEKSLYVVADGMGGHAKGEKASGEMLKEIRERMGSTEGAADIMNAISAAKHRLNYIAANEPETAGLGTTVAGVFLKGTKALVFNCGDSRVYRLVDRYIEKISKDHSLVEELVESGLLAEEDRRFHPQKNIITSAIIGDLNDDLPEVYFKEVKITGRQLFMLCTDGVWESMDAADIEECFISRDLDGVVDCLFSKTMNAGARDNLSVIALEVTAG